MTVKFTVTIKDPTGSTENVGKIWGDFLCVSVTWDPESGERVETWERGKYYSSIFPKAEKSPIK
jgi:hypothetical protein